MSNLEFRQVPNALLEVRVSADSRAGRVVADVMKYNVVDDYRTTFTPGCFTASLETRMPRILWSHNPNDPIGRWVEADDNRTRLRLVGDLDLAMIDGTNMPAVPSAHRAYAQLRSGTVDQFSVGFLRQAEERNTPRQGVTAITQALLDEASPVLVGSVPGAVLVSVRSRTQNLVEPRRRLTFFPARALEARAAGKGGQFAKGGGRVPAMATAATGSVAPPMAAASSSASEMKAAGYEVSSVGQSTRGVKSSGTRTHTITATGGYVTSQQYDSKSGVTSNLTHPSLQAAFATGRTFLGV